MFLFCLEGLDRNACGFFLFCVCLERLDKDVLCFVLQVYAPSQSAMLDCGSTPLNGVIKNQYNITLEPVECDDSLLT